MLFILICSLLLLLVLAVLLIRQVDMTRRAVEGSEEWKRLYEQAHRDRATALQKYKGLEHQNRVAASRLSVSGGEPLISPKVDKANREILSAVAESPPAEKVAKMSDSLTLILPIQLLSKNARDKLHYQARNKLRQQYQDIIQTKYPRRAEPPQVRQRATVTRILGPRERRFDQQNIGAGTAIELVDALTAAGYWVDDNETWLETRFEQGSSKKLKGPAVAVEIEVLSG